MNAAIRGRTQRPKWRSCSTTSAGRVVSWWLGNDDKESGAKRMPLHHTVERSDRDFVLHQPVPPRNERRGPFLVSSSFLLIPPVPRLRPDTYIRKLEDPKPYAAVSPLFRSDATAQGQLANARRLGRKCHSPPRSTKRSIRRPYRKTEMKKSEKTSRLGRRMNFSL
jgi:hypothetical protein